MLLEVAAVVVIVSLLPRFDLRPPAQAQERAPSVEPQRQTSLASFAVASAPESDSRPTINSSPNLLSVAPIATNQAPAAVERTPLSAHEVEQRLDQASQQLLNQLGSATASWASDVRHAASRPAWQPAP
jgi:hypothetical protein